MKSTKAFAMTESAMTDNAMPDGTTEAEDAATPGRTPRDSMLLMGKVKVIGDFARAALPMRIRNLSATGLMAETCSEYDVGCLVEIELRGIGYIAGQIVWVRGERMGITFDKDIDPKRARQPLTAQADEWLRKVEVAKVRRPGLRID